MSPALSRRFELFRCKLRVVNEDVRTRRQFAQAPVQFRVARLVVRGVRHDPRRRLDSKAQAALRMIQPARHDLVLPDRKRIAAVHFLELSLGAHRRHVHGKIGQRHLRFENLFLGRDSLKQVFEAQMALPYFPVDMSAMSAKRKFKEVDGGDSFTVGENKIMARWLNHPQGCLGFRIETPAGIVAYATDNEPGDAKLDGSLRELAAGADIFINDAQFTPEQLETTRKGWGHSSWLEGVKVARQAGAKTLVLFHHDPDSTDRMVDSILRRAREEFDSVFAASEGMVVTLGAPGDRVQAHMPGTRTALRREAQFHAKVCGVTEGGKDFEEETVVRDISLQGALISLKHLPRLQSELQVTMEAPGGDGVQTMRLRGYVVRIDAGAEKGRSAVGVVFTDGFRVLKLR